MATDREQDIDLGLTRNEYNDPTRPRRAVLTISTGKHYYGLGAEARVYWVGNHFRSCAMSLGASGGDYSRTLAKVPNGRATQKAIDTLHAQTFTPETIASLTAEALAYYAEGKDKR